jgi:hypothetical protein
MHFSKSIGLALLVLLVLPSLRTYAQNPHSLSQAGFKVEVTPLPPNQIGAFFEARGFSPQASTKIGADCVIKVVVRNLSARAIIRNSLADWRVRDKAGHEQALRLEADWQQAWTSGADVSPSARIAFRYSMLPTVETLKPGDWLQGLVTAGLTPGSHFDLRIVWTDNDKPKQAWLRGLSCAP